MPGRCQFLVILGGIVCQLIWISEYFSHEGFVQRPQNGDFSYFVWTFSHISVDTSWKAQSRFFLIWDNHDMVFMHGWSQTLFWDFFWSITNLIVSSFWITMTLRVTSNIFTVHRKIIKLEIRYRNYAIQWWVRSVERIMGNKPKGKIFDQKTKKDKNKNWTGIFSVYCTKCLHREMCLVMQA